MSTTKQRAGGRSGLKSGLGFEQVVKKKYNGIKPKREIDCFGQKTTTPKTDLIIKNQNYSIKNPKTKGLSTQIQVCSLERFCKKFEPPKDVKLALEMFIGAHKSLFEVTTFKNNPKHFKSFCINEWKIDPSKLHANDELRRSRLLYKNIPNNTMMLKWLQDNIVEITRFVFSEGFNTTQSTIAKMIGWTTIKNDVNSIKTFDIDAIIKKIAKDKPACTVRESQSVIQIGFFTLQMKGSGKTSAYHNMQFNCSYNDLADFMKQTGGII